MQPQQPPPTGDVSNCYVFKSRLQEYAQKVSLPTPVYETIKEGPSHEPTFRSTVIVDNVRYDSLPGFFNRKAAEQSAAEVALFELVNNSEESDCIAQPVHETGLCKNLLQEYAQKMNYAIPLYECQKVEAARGSRVTSFSGTVEIGGIRYIGTAARTKKQAEISAARTALLAIQTSGSDASKCLNAKTELTVRPCKKRGPETNNAEDDVLLNPPPKKKSAKKASNKKKPSKYNKIRRNNNKLKNAEEPNVVSGTDDAVERGFNQYGSMLTSPSLINLSYHIITAPGEEMSSSVTDGGCASSFFSEVEVKEEVSGVGEVAPPMLSNELEDCGKNSSCFRFSIEP